MNAQTEEVGSVLDVVKQVFALALIVAALVAFYYFSEFLLLYRVLALVAIFGAAMGLLLTTAAGRGFWRFVLESKQEVRKVVWPTRQETMTTTLLVFGAVIIVGFLLWLFDLMLAGGVRYLIDRGG